MLITILLLFFAAWWFAVKKLAGPDLSRFDSSAGQEIGQIFNDHEDDAAASQDFLLTLNTVRQKAVATKSLMKGLAVAREFADNLSHDLESDCEFTPVIANGVSCEWCVAPDSDPERRVLFIHGGAFILGSPNGHRRFAHQFAHLAKAAVLSVDYRLLPEHQRMTATHDVQNAYHWILSQGPNGDTALKHLIVAGDSAGGNLALMASEWSKTGAARKPNAVIGFSPSTDTTLASPLITKNTKTDLILGKVLGLINKVPRPIALWVALIGMRANPSNPLVSPVFGDLSELPPTLIHASSSEMLLGDAIRYTNKANAAGSQVELQVWKNQIHDWHLFNSQSGSGKEAWQKVAEFIQRTA